MTDADEAHEWFLLAHRLHMRGRRVDEAETAYRNAMAAGRSDAGLYLGVLLSGEPGRERDTEAALRTAMSCGVPKVAWRAASELGDMLLKVHGDAAGARECFEFAARQEPESTWPNATLNLAYLHAAAGNREGTRAAFERFVEMRLASMDSDVTEATGRRIAHFAAAMALGRRTGPALRRLRVRLYRLRRLRRRMRSAGLRPPRITVASVRVRRAAGGRR